MIFSAHSGSFRAVKALNSFAQLAIAMCIVCSIMGPEGIEYEAAALGASFWAMRLLSPIMFALESCGARSGKFASALVFTAFLALFITAQVVIGLNLDKLGHQMALRNAMAAASLVCIFFFELFLWDTLVMPLLLMGVCKCSPKARNVFSAMKL